jgi:hypothetical protein
MMALSPLLLSTAAAADDGQYVILNAQYGNENNHVDVTNRLKEVARRNRPFRVNHDTMAADPAHGQAKMLRVFARGPDGRERFFDYPDGAGFDPAQFRGWGRGDWGDEHWSGGWNGRNDNDHDAGEYLILTARYGNEHRQVDVTNRLKKLARQDRVFRVDYRTLGVEPGERMENVLRIFARGPNGQERMFEYRENSLIDGALFRGWGNGEWGGGGWSGNWNGGGGDAGLFVILSAQYGSERRHVDVTHRLREMVRSDREFRVDFRTFGDDPDEGRPKVLRIYARGPNGRERMFEYRDGSVIDGAQFRGWRSGEWGDDHDHWSGRWEEEEREEHQEREQQR